MMLHKKFDKPLLTTKEAALFLGVSYQCLENGRCGHGKINPPFVRIGRLIRYRLEDLIRYLEEHLVIIRKLIKRRCDDGE